MNKEEFRQEEEKDLISWLSTKKLLKADLVVIQGKLRQTRNKALSPDEVEQYLMQEEEVKFKIEDLDKLIDDTGRRMASFKLALENERETLVIPAKNLPSLNDYPSFIRNEHNIDDFLEEFTRFMNHYKFPKSDWGQELLYCFNKEKDAHRLVKKYITTCENDWDKLSVVVRKHFGISTTDFDKFNDLFHFEQKEDEQPDCFSDRFDSLLEECHSCDDPFNAYQVFTYLRSCKSSLRDNIIKSPQFKTKSPKIPKLEEIYEIAREFKVRNQFPKLEPPPIIYNSTRKVFHTKKVGALTVSDPQEYEQLNSDSLYNKTDDKIYYPPSNCEITDNGLFIPVEINSIPTLGLVDTGSQISIVSDKFVSNCKGKVVKKEGAVVFADGKTNIPRFVTKERVQLKCGNSTIIREFDVMSLPSGVNFLIGRDLFPKLNIALVNMPFVFPSTCNKVEQETYYNRNFGSIQLEDCDHSIKQALEPCIVENSKLVQTQPCNVNPSGVKITLKMGAKPCFTRQYPISRKKQEGMDKVIKNWLQNDVIIRCKEGSRFNTPLLAVPKRDHSGMQVGTRVCLDFRKLNEIIEDEKYEVPLITDIFLEASGNKFYSTIDLTDAYTQVPLSEESQPLTAFTWKGLQYMFKRCIYGLKTMTSVFQRLITNVLEPCINFCRPYLDDIVIFSKSKEEHINHVTQVMSCLNKALLKINPSKSKFGMRKILLLGFLVNEEGIFPDNSKIAAITETKPPRNVREMRSFLGKCNYLRSHIPGYAHISAPLEKQRNAKGEIFWGKAEENSFFNLKAAIKKAKILSLPKSDLPFYLATDASNNGIGSMLYQIENGKYRFISFDSRVLTNSERNYSASKKELLALVYGLNQNFYFLSGRKFIVQTDHQALTFLFTQRHTNLMMNNWLETILSFNFSVIYIPGKENYVPDFLSRNPLRNDNKLIGNVTLGEETNNSASNPENKIIKKNRVMQELTNLHLQGHFQADQMVKQLRHSGRKITNAKKKCRQIANSCEICKKYNPASPKYKPLTSIDAHQPFDHIMVDLVTDLPKSQDNYVHALVITDVFSKFTLLFPLVDKKGNSIVKILAKVVADHGTPKIIQSDRGTEFCNDLVERLCGYLKIEKRTSVAYSPRTNGLVERTNQTWVRILKKLADSKQSSWPDYLAATQIFLNNRIPESLPVTSFEAFYGRRNNEFYVDYSKAKLFETDDDEIVKQIQFIKEFFWPEVRTFSVSYHKRKGENFKSKAPLKDPPFKVGSEVYVKAPNPGKLDQLFEGPFKITGVNKFGSFKLRNSTGRAYHRTVNTAQLKDSNSPTLKRREEDDVT